MSNRNFFLNVFEIISENGDKLLCYFIPQEVLNRIGSSRYAEIKSSLLNKDLIYAWINAEYLEFKPGIYVFSEEAPEVPYVEENVINEVHIGAKSYISRFLLRRLVEKKLLEKKDELGILYEGTRYGSPIYLRTNPIFVWKLKNLPIYEFYEEFTYRVEHVREMNTDRLFLLIDRSLRVTSKVCLKDLLSALSLDVNVLRNALVDIRVRVKQNDKFAIGVLSDVNIEQKTAHVNFGTYELKDVTFDNIFLPENPLWATRLFKFGGVEKQYEQMLNKYGELTLRTTYDQRLRRRVKMKDAPRRYFSHLKDLVNTIFQKIFPIKFQDVTYTLSDEPTTLNVEYSW